MNWMEKLFSYFRFQDPPPKPRRVYAIPPDEERCIGNTEAGGRCKFRRSEGLSRCGIHQKIYQRIGS